MKRVCLFLSVFAVATAFCGAAEPKAVLHKVDGRAWQVFLVGYAPGQLTYRLEKSDANKVEPISGVASLDIKHPDYSASDVDVLFAQADYAGVIEILEPVALQAGPFMAMENNLKRPFSLLMRAYYGRGDMEKAKKAAAQLSLVSDPELKDAAQVISALVSLKNGNIESASATLNQVVDPAAKLYIQASVMRANSEYKQALQTAINLIQLYPNNLKWMPVTELLCAELYVELGMLNSAEATARQVQTFYVGTATEQEAKKLREQVQQLEIAKKKLEEESK